MARRVTWIDKPTHVPCQNEAAHTPAPERYFAWHEWAEEMSKAHRQERCPGCDLFKIWIPTGDTT